MSGTHDRYYSNDNPMGFGRRSFRSTPTFRRKDVVDLQNCMVSKPRLQAAIKELNSEKGVGVVPRIPTKPGIYFVSEQTISGT